MGSKGVERRKQATPGQTPEGNVVMSFSFESYQLEEEDCQVKDISDKGVLALSEHGECLLHMTLSQFESFSVTCMVFLYGYTPYLKQE